MLERNGENERVPQRQIAVDRSRITRWRAIEDFLSLPPGWKILRDGDLTWLHPTPSLDWYHRLYDESYLTDACNPAAPGDAEFEERRIRYFRRRIKRIVSHMGRKPESLLEIGSGDGLFLVAARRSGIEATGTDISTQAQRDAQGRHGANILVGDLLSDQWSLPGQYDVIVMNHVLEHLINPLDYLARIHSLLRPDGLLVFEIPQQFINPIDLIYRACGVRRPLGPYTVHHPYFYTVASTRRLMKTSSFRIEHLTTWLPSQVFHTRNPWLTIPLQILLWIADRATRRGHIIEVFARPI